MSFWILHSRSVTMRQPLRGHRTGNLVIRSPTIPLVSTDKVYALLAADRRVSSVRQAASGQSTRAAARVYLSLSSGTTAHWAGWTPSTTRSSPYYGTISLDAIDNIRGKFTPGLYRAPEAGRRGLRLPDQGRSGRRPGQKFPMLSG